MQIHKLRGLARGHRRRRGRRRRCRRRAAQRARRGRPPASPSPRISAGRRRAAPRCRSTALA
uniref:Uncharacterized protein n=1 Tax=Arundo donax TaxID=35708 RepID=A0A0A9HNC2_ARUDO